MTRRVLSAILLFSLSCPLGWAGTVPGRWEKVDSLSRGTPLFINLKQGERVEGFFRGSDNSGVTVQTASGSLVKYAKDDVRSMVRRRAKSDPLWHGTLMGAAIGGGAGAAIGALAAGSNDNTCNIDVVTRGEAATTAGLVGVASGAILGLVLDKANGNAKSDELIYQARVD